MTDFRSARRPAIALAVAIAVVTGITAQRAAMAEPRDGPTERVGPEFREAMHRYAIVDRGDGKVYDLYVDPRTLEVWRSQRRLPDGAIFAIESFAPHADGLREASGHLVRGASENDVHVAVKSTGWGREDVPTSTGLLFGQPTEDGRWRMDGFDPRTGARTPDLDIAECHACHLDRRAEDFILSRGLLDRFARTGAPARITFDCVGREICF